ncbi:hypothetical protein O3P69_015534 [Scylla paramamosain]|uniref:Uncharacterized protein n=1 Tax=Scylla paramamosain TaxID=85552 RepID=A0AAW0SHB6_SCYPA
MIGPHSSLDSENPMVVAYTTAEANWDEIKEYLNAKIENKMRFLSLIILRAVMSDEFIVLCTPVTDGDMQLLPPWCAVLFDGDYDSMEAEKNPRQKNKRAATTPATSNSDDDECVETTNRFKKAFKVVFGNVNQTEFAVIDPKKEIEDEERHCATVDFDIVIDNACHITFICHDYRRFSSQMASFSSSTDGRAKGVKYPFCSTHTLLWKSCQRDNGFANTMKGSKKRNAETASSNMMHGNSNHFETSKVDAADTYRLPTNRSTIDNVFHPGGLLGAGKTATITSLIEDLADANMTGKGAVLPCSNANATKSKMFSSCIDQSTPGKDGGYMLESKFVTINLGFAIPVIKNSADTEDVMIQCYINNLSRCKMRKDALVDRQSYIKCLIDDSMAVTNEVPNKRPRTSSSSTSLEAAKEEDSFSMDGLDLFDDSDFEELMTKMLDVHERPLTTFAVGRFICTRVLPCYVCQVLARLPNDSGRSSRK